jgi:Ca2+-binding RTX toxin-like protein
MTNFVLGTQTTDLLTGTSENDAIDHSGMGDDIIGLLGCDRALFFERASRFSVQTLAGVTHIVGLDTANPSYANYDDLLVNVEQAQFFDRTIDLATTEKNVVIGSNTVDTIVGTGEDDVIEHRAGADNIDGGEGNDIALFFDRAGRFNIQSLSGVTHIVGLDTANATYANQDDLLINVEQAVFLDRTIDLVTTDKNVVVGSNGLDSLVGTLEDDVIEHRGGADDLNGREGHDTALFFEQSSRFSIQTLSGVTHIVGLDTANAIYADQDDLLINIEQVQFLDRTIPLATTEKNVIVGSNTAELLIGTGEDDLIEHRGSGDDIDGREGEDTALFFEQSARFSVQTLSGVTHIAGLDTANATYANQDDLLINVERAQFLDRMIDLTTTNKNIVLGSNAPESLIASGQDDVIEHRGGTDNIDGGEGNDVALFFDLASRFDVQTLSGVTHIIGLDTANATYANEDDLLVNVEQAQFLDATISLATTDKNVVIGSNMGESLAGTGEDDVIEHRGGADDIDGREGNDIALFFDQSFRFSVQTLSGVTHIVGLDNANATYAAQDNLLINVERAQFLDRSINVATVDKNIVIGTNAADSLIGTAEDDVIEHRAGADDIDGREGNDIALFFDRVARFNIQTLSGVTHIVGFDTANATYANQDNLLINVEQAQFVDATINLATTEKNIVLGSNFDDVITGSDVDDIIEHRGGDDDIDGREGNDIALFFEQSSRFSMQTLSGVTHIVGFDNANATYANQDNLLFNVEQVQFLDRTIDLVTTDNNVILGSNAAEAIVGTGEDDIIEHRGGADNIDGREGNDRALFFDRAARFSVQTLSGVTHIVGFDTANASYARQDNLLTNVEQAQFLDATINLATTDKNVVIGSNVGEDLTGSSVDDVIEHRGGADNIDGREGSDVALFFEQSSRFSMQTLSGVTHIVGFDNANATYANQDNLLINVEQAQFLDWTVNLATTDKNVVIGSNVAETIVGTSEDDVIEHRGGADDMDGGEGNDIALFFDRAGRFSVQTLSGVTHIVGFDTASATYADQDNLLISVEQAQFIDATINLTTTDSNVVLGTNGRDSILTGTGEADIIEHRGDSDDIDGREGEDVALFFEHSSRFSVQTLSGVTHIVGLDTAIVTYANQDDLLINVEQAQFLDRTIDLATTDKNVVLGSNGDDAILGTGGDDVIEHRGGTDNVDGGEGEDVALFFDRAARFNIQTLSGVTHVVGFDTAKATYANQDDLLINVEQAQFLDQTIDLVTTDKNVVLGTNGSETLIGTGEDDIIEHRGGADDIDGGEGNDIALFFEQRSRFVMQSLSGVTYIAGLDTANATYATQENLLINVEQAQFLDQTIDLVTTDKNVVLGTSAVDSLIGTGGDDVIEHRGGADDIDGGDGNDVALFFANRSQFEIRTLTGVTHIRGLETAPAEYAGVVDRLVNVEQIQFLDTTITLDDGLPETNGTAISEHLIGGACDEQLNGLAGDDFLDGQGGWNVLNGGPGNDTYRISSPDTSITEQSGEGFDQALSAVSFDLSISSTYLEQLILTGSDNLDALGDDNINRLSGNDGNNLIYGAGGTDVLRGGLGRDEFYFRRAEEGGDEIADFSRTEGDKLIFHSPNFGALRVGTLAAANFVANRDGTAQDGSDFFVFSLDSNSLYFDSDGNGAAPATLIARFGVDVTLDNTDIAIT